MNFIPYAEVDGCWSLSDTHVKEYYDQMSLEDFFFNGVMSKDNFVKFCKSPENYVVFFPGGIGMINQAKEGRCVGHINFWKDSIQNGKAFVEHVFSLKDGEKAIINTILGFTPIWNQRAIKYIEKVGFKSIGVIPKYGMTNRGISDFNISYMVNLWV